MEAEEARAEPREAQAAAPRRALSLLRYSPALLAFIIAVADAGRWADPDLWGHLVFGRLILMHGHLPPRDIYSYSALGLPWHDHEWLSEVVLALSWSSFGVVGLKLMKLACTAATITLLAMGAAETGAPIQLQLLVLTTGAAAIAPMIQFRPQLFDFVALSALLMLLARDSYWRAGRLWLAIPIFALWANLHGGFFVGLAALAVYTALAAVEDFAAGNGLSRVMRLGGVTAGCVLATLCNPDGIGNWFTVMHTMRNPLTRAVISEWQPLLFKIAEEWHKSPKTAVNFALVIVPFAALALCFVIKPRGGDLALVVIAAMMGAAAYLAVRNMGLAVIASTTPLCRHVSLALKATRFRNPAPPAPRKRAHEVLVGAIAFLLALSTGLFSGRLSVGHPQPHGAVEFMRVRGLRGNVLGAFAWGEYLIFHLAPESRVFVDSRYDMVYPQRVLADYLDFFLAGPRAVAVLDAYPHDFVLIPPTAAARVLMERRADWKLIYSDPSALLFARAGSAGAQLKGIPVQGQAGPNLFP
ncbi:MAG TPA: hypothetical protein VFE43_04695 [Candidatus Binataceae bacterium]|nr:hypothetical protein [Candidatus Binataceae bacterium]